MHGLQFYFPLQTIPCVYINGFSPNLVYDIVEIWFGIVNGLSVCIFISGRLLSNKYQWLFTKLGMCIDILKIWFEIVNG